MLSSSVRRFMGRVAPVRSASRTFSAGERDWSAAPPLVIRNGMVVNHDGMYKADVMTQEGKIIKVGNISEDEVVAGARTIDATGRYIIPGGIDTHTHLETTQYLRSTFLRQALLRVQKL